MKIDEQTAVVDNDFTNHLAEAHLDDDQLVELLHTIFSDLDLLVAIHPLVYQYELRQDLPRIRLLFDRGVVAKAEFADIHRSIRMMTARKPIIRIWWKICTGPSAAMRFQPPFPMSRSLPAG